MASVAAHNPHGLYTDGTRTGHGLYTDDRSDGSPCAKVGFTFSVGGDMERRRLAGMKPVSLSHH